MKEEEEEATAKLVQQSSSLNCRCVKVAVAFNLNESIVSTRCGLRLLIAHRLRNFW